MTNKAKDNHVQRVPPPEEGDLQKSDLPPDGGPYRERSARERTSALPPDEADYRETSALPPQETDLDKSVLPPDEADYHETSALPPGKMGQTDAMSPRREDYGQEEAER